jgi:hypothetical protein
VAWRLRVAARLAASRVAVMLALASLAAGSLVGALAYSTSTVAWETVAVILSFKPHAIVCAEDRGFYLACPSVGTEGRILLTSLDVGEALYHYAAVVSKAHEALAEGPPVGGGSVGFLLRVLSLRVGGPSRGVLVTLYAATPRETGALAGGPGGLYMLSTPGSGPLFKPFAARLGAVWLGEMLMPDRSQGRYKTAYLVYVLQSPTGRGDAGRIVEAANETLEALRPPRGGEDGRGG